LDIIHTISNHGKNNILKKITLFLLLLSSLYSKEQFYFGTNGGVVNETLRNSDAKSSSYMANFKFGYGILKSYAIELSFDAIANKSKSSPQPKTGTRIKSLLI